LYYITNNTDNVVVLFNGALSGKPSSRPTFMRWSWAYENNVSFISFDDPVVSCTQLTNLGWYVGTENYDIQEYINNIIVHLTKTLNISPSRISFYGSSGGGFAAIMASIRLKNSIAIACNPQTNVFNYYEKFSKKFTDSFFQGVDLSSESNIYYRFCLKAAILKFDYIPTIIYNQNIQDKFHLEKHFIPFQSTLINLLSSIEDYPNQLHVNLICDKRGHSSISSKEQFAFELEQANVLNNENIHYPPLHGSTTHTVLDDNVIWYYVGDEKDDLKISFNILSDVIVETEKPAIFLVDTENLEHSTLKKNGYSYSQRLKCAFKYIEKLNSNDETIITVDKNMKAIRIGFRGWNRLGNLRLNKVKIVSGI